MTMAVDIPMKSRRTFGILLMRVILLCILPVLLLSIYFAYKHFEEMRFGSQQQAAHLVQNIASSLDQHLRARMGRSQLPAASTLVDAPMTRENAAHAPQTVTVETSELQSRLHEFSFPAQWALTVLDSGNAIIASRVPFGWVAQAGDGGSAERFQHNLDLAPWTVVLEIPPDAYFRPLLISAALIIALLVFTSLSSVIGARWAARRLSKAVTTLTKTTTDPTRVDASFAEIEMVRTALAAAEESRAAAYLALQESEVSHRAMVESNPQPMWVYDVETLAFLTVNDAAVAQYGYSREEFLTMTIKDIRPKEEVPALLEAIAHAQTGRARLRCWRHCRKDGSTLLVEVNAYSIKLGNRAARVVLTHDVTAREHAATKLRLSEESLSITLKSIGDAVIATDATGVITRLNPTAERLTGWTQSDAIGRPLIDVLRIVDTLTRQPLANPLAAVLTSGEVVGLTDHTTLQARDGREFQISDSAAPIRDVHDHIVGMVLVFSDVTASYRTQQSLARTTALLERTGEVARIGGWELDLGPMKLFWSAETFRIHEWEPPHPPTFAQGLALFAPDAQPVMKAAMHAAIDSGVPYDLELQKFTAKGRRIWIRTQCSPVTEDGKVVKLVGALHDITARKHAELALRESQAFNVAILDSVAAEIAVLDGDGMIIAVNEPWQRFALENGIEAGHAAPHTGVGTSYLAVCQPAEGDDDASAYAGIRAVLNGERQSFVLEYPCHSPDQHRWFSMSVTPLGADRRGAVVVHTDITARRVAEAERASLEVQLRESQKMEAIGTLAGGIAHDFNNILANIIGNTELARQDLAIHSRARESLDEIRKAGGRARDLVQQILSFSRRQPTARKVISLMTAIKDSERLLRPSLPPRVALEVRCNSDVPPALADATQIEQVVVNLVTNAMQAMRGRAGHIGIWLDTMTLDEAFSDAHPLLQTMFAEQPGQIIIRLAVTDNGPGMDTATLGRIFEPFFTTKPVDEGTGLGLSVVLGIVQTHQGQIEVQSAPGAGTTFAIYLPSAKAGLDDLPTIEKVAAHPVSAGETSGKHILYLDDDESLVFLVKRALERRGYRISGFTDQREAVAAIRADPTSFDLFVTDYNMPGMSGLDVAREVATIRSDLPLAIASGFIDDALSKQAVGVVRELIFKANGVEDLCEAFVRLAEALHQHPKEQR